MMDLRLLKKDLTIIVIPGKSVGEREFGEGVKEFPESMELYHKIKKNKKEKEAVLPQASFTWL